jgi:hypothetical protein
VGERSGCHTVDQHFYVVAIIIGESKSVWGAGITIPKE